MKIIKDIVAALLVLLSPIKGVVITVLALCVADLAIALVSAIQRKEPVESSGIRKTVLKIGMYETAILLTFMVNTYLVPDMPLLKAVSGIIGMSELKSVLEHLDDLSGGSAISAVTASVRRMVSRRIPKIRKPRKKKLK